jgi:hypothetical protein
MSSGQGVAGAWALGGRLVRAGGFPGRRERAQLRSAALLPRPASNTSSLTSGLVIYRLLRSKAPTCDRPYPAPADGSTNGSDRIAPTQQRTPSARFCPSASAGVAVRDAPAPDELQARLPNRHRRFLPCGSGRLTRAPTSGSPPEQTARPKRGREAGHPLKRAESGANCEDQQREANPQEPLVSRNFAPLGR